MFVRGDEDQLRPRLDVDVGGGPQAGAARHLDVHDHEIGTQFADPVERHIAVGRAADQLDPLDIAEEAGQAVQCKGLVVHQQYAHKFPPRAVNS